MKTNENQKDDDVSTFRAKLLAVEKELASAKLQIKLLEHRILHGCPLKAEDTQAE